jgi:hypothetical protein
VVDSEQPERSDCARSYAVSFFFGIGFSEFAKDGLVNDESRFSLLSMQKTYGLGKKCVRQRYGVLTWF